MKTQINTQKTAKAQAKKTVLRGSIVIIGLVLISWKVCSQDFWKQMLTTNSPTEITMLMVEDSPESEDVNAAISAIMNEWEVQSDQSKNKQVKADLVDSEASRNTNDFIHEAETVTALEADRQIEMYADRLILLQKNSGTNDKVLHSAAITNSQEANKQDDRFAEKHMKRIELK